MLRYSNRSLYGLMEDSPLFYIVSPRNVASSEVEGFFEELWKLIQRLSSEATAGGSLRKFAVNNTTTSDLKTIFAQAQCTPDLSKQDCTDCLVGAYEDITTYSYGKDRARILKPSCNIRYEPASFLDPANVAPLPSLPPISPPSPSTNTTNSEVLCLELGLLPQHGRSGFEIGQRLPSYSDWRSFNGSTGQLAVVQSYVRASFWWMGLLVAPVIWPALVLTPTSMAWLLGSLIQGDCCRALWWLRWVETKLGPAERQRPYLGARRWVPKSDWVFKRLGWCAEDADESRSAESLQFDFGTIRVVTDDFSEAYKLGHGGFGSVYRGKLPNGEEIAVKRLSMDSGQGDLEFKNEVLLVARLPHRNLVRLLGFCLEGNERLLVYEYLPNASLDNIIFDPIKRDQLDWDKRYKIIEDIARGLLYLHVDSLLRIIHRDLKASNILIDAEMNPKISDFGMARLFVHDETQGNTNRIVGT
ncbi:putative protein kinase RLK-Pelle-DLSV family [Rosa chinensis]|uniref:Protein kinase domain-containing protein n=1 Tax=Rosa chinensis TaxID=74649 RepID=A0A2P6RQS9_ROSCH|nr:putative protein kinase RLK-Pelle-DLSV family [Rosa chinensis]